MDMENLVLQVFGFAQVYWRTVCSYTKYQLPTWIRLSLLPVWITIAPSLRLVGSRGATDKRNNQNAHNINSGFM